MEKDLEYFKTNNYYGFIYLTTNNLNGKIYIGQKKFCFDYKKYLGSGIYFKNSLKKYGKSNFSRIILRYCKTLEETNYFECFYIKMFCSQDLSIGYNIDIGGDSKVKTQEIKDKISKTLTGRIRPIEEIEKARLSNLANNRKLSKEHKNIISKKMLGNMNRVQPYKLTNIHTKEELLFNTAKSCYTFLNLDDPNFFRYVNGFRKDKPHLTKYKDHVFKEFKIEKITCQENY